MKAQRLFGIVIILIVGATIAYINHLDDKNTNNELASLIKSEIGSLKVCPINKTIDLSNCTLFESSEVIDKFVLSLKGSQASSLPEHIAITFESVILVKSKNTDSWFRAIEYEGITEKLYLSKIEFLGENEFRKTPYSFAMADGYKQIFY